MMLKRNGGFRRGIDYAHRCHELMIQQALTPQQVRLTEYLLENALTARRTGTGPDDERIARLMLDWQILRAALEDDL